MPESKDKRNTDDIVAHALVEAQKQQIGTLSTRLDEHVGTLHEKFNCVDKKVARLEVKVEQTTQQNKQTAIALKEHLVSEEATFREMSDRVQGVQTDIAYMRGRAEEKAAWEKKAGIIRFFITILKFFGINLGG